MNDTGLYQSSNLGELYQRVAGRFEHRTAIVAGDTRITYGEMYRQVLQMTGLFEHHGLKRGDAIAILAGNMPEVVIAIAAAQVMGLRFTALHALGSFEDHCFILRDGEIQAVLVDGEHFGQRGTELLQAVSGLNLLFSIGPHDHAVDVVSTLERYAPHTPRFDVEPDDIALVAYTGGTTGKPKGVVHTHRSILHMINIELAEWEWPEDVVFLAVAPVSHAVGGMLLPTLLRGGRFVLEQSFSPNAFFRIVAEERISATFLVPTMIYALLDHPAIDSYDLSSLEMLIYGAAPMQVPRLRDGLEKFGSIFCQIYGQVEAPNTITYMRKTDHDGENQERLSSCGIPVLGVDLKIMDQQFQEVARGEIGEIYVRGPHLMQRYWRREQETQSAIGQGWLKTGDLARQDAKGFIYIVDRSKDMIITGGFNVYPSEIEAVIEEHPAVNMSAVIGIPDAIWGEAVTAIVTLNENQTCEADEIVDHVKQMKGSVQTPKKIVFAESLPLTPLGKIDKKIIREIYG